MATKKENKKAPVKKTAPVAKKAAVKPAKPVAKTAVKKEAIKTTSNKKVVEPKKVVKKIEKVEEVKPVEKVVDTPVVSEQPKEVKVETKIEEKPQEVINENVDNTSLAGNSPYERAVALYGSEPYQKALNELQSLRKDGDWKILKIKDENIDVRINKQINKEGKKRLLEDNKKEMHVAKAVSMQNKDRIKEIVAEMATKSKEEFTPIFEAAKEECKRDIKAAKVEYIEAIKKAKEEHAKDLEEIKAKYANSDDKKALKVDLNAAEISYKSKINAARSARFDAIQKAKEERYSTYQASYEYFSKLRLNKHTEGENSKYGYETYLRNFNFSTWLTKNALFLIVGIVFLVMVTMMGVAGTLNTNWFLNALTSIAPKIFFALGVAGLILLGGTDLSIARLAAVGASFSLMILTDAQNSKTWFPHLYTSPLAVRVIVAIVVSIALCTLFTSISGFFTAKFKMHPFISTLAMQLIVFGFFQTFFGSVSAFTIDSDNVQKVLAGQGGWLLIVYAAIAILIVWFIWNKTKFGKNLYAVGGNPEAAAVSGINPFKITMLAFVMAGILYGLGGFTYALQSASANFNSCTGFDTDAIAACVIGGISFSGGVGSVLGAVGGAVILGFLTACFNALGIDTNIQFVIKGLIILIAVTLDCVKYIRKK